MNLQNSLFIWWKNVQVGQLKNPILDMGYIEGIWQPNINDFAKEFTIKAGKLVPKQVIINPAKGFRIKFSDVLADEPTIHAYVLELKNGILLIKMVSDNDSVEGLIKTVPE